MPRYIDQPIRPSLQTFREDVPHPSQRRGNAYSQDVQEIAVQNRLNGNDFNPAITELQQQWLYPHPDTVDKFVARHAVVGHSRAYQRTGNARSEREVLGIYLVHFAMYRACLPKATAAEVNAYLFQMNRWDPTYEPYSNSQLTRANQRLHLTKKKSSTTAYQALQPANVLWRDMYWNMIYPYGMANVDPRFVIDIDESSGSVDGSNRTSGTCLIGERAAVNTPIPGKYLQDNDGASGCFYNGENPSRSAANTAYRLTFSILFWSKIDFGHV